MGLFSRFTPSKPDGAVPSTRPVYSGSDKMMLFGAMLRDLASGNGPETLMGTQRMLAGRQQQAAKLAAQQSVSDLFGSSLPSPSEPMNAATNAPRAVVPSISDPAVAQRLLAAQNAGADISDALEIMKANKPPDPNVVVTPTGVAIDSRDASNVGKFFPQLDKGQEPLYDRQGNVVGVRNLLGAIQAAADMAGAVTGAQEGARAEHDLVSVPRADGSSVMVPRALAVQLLGQGGVGGGFGVQQSPAAQAEAVDTAKAGVEQRTAAPKRFAGLESQSRATDLAIETINSILGQSLTPDGGFVQSGDSLISGMNTGWAANTAGIKGTPAYSLEQKIAPLRAIIGFDNLQSMRDNSPTGGALGNITERENTLLQSLYGSLDPGQDPRQFAQSLQQVRDQLLQVRRERQQLYDQTYGVGGQSATPVAPRMTGARGSRIVSVQ